MEVQADPVARVARAEDQQFPMPFANKIVPACFTYFTDLSSGPELGSDRRLGAKRRLIELLVPFLLHVSEGSRPAHVRAISFIGTAAIDLHDVPSLDLIPRGMRIAADASPPPAGDHGQEGYAPSPQPKHFRLDDVAQFDLRHPFFHGCKAL